MDESTGTEYGSGFGYGEYSGCDLTGETDPVTGYVDSIDLVESSDSYDPTASFDA